jgi:ribosomal protein S27E
MIVNQNTPCPKCRNMFAVVGTGVLCPVCGAELSKQKGPRDAIVVIDGVEYRITFYPDGAFVAVAVEGEAHK